MGGKIILNGKEYASSTPGGGASSFADLDDVDLTFLQDGEFPQYNSLTQKWENVTLTKVNDVKVNGTSVVNSNLVANIKSYKEVTQAEYEALPDSKTSDGIAYFITDAVEAEGYPPLIYSLQEREIGVWIDGRPLYQKSFYITDNISTSFDFNHGINNFDFCTNAEGTVIYDSGDDLYTEPLCTGNEVVSGWGNSIIDIHKTYFSILIGSSRSSASGVTAINVTLRYVKTTDTPGQGIWAGNGAMAHHYSTEEVIVGTWIDGKPLYEKTISYNNLHIRNTEQLLDTNLLTVDTFISARGSWVRSDGTCDNLPSVHTNDAFCVSPNDFNKTTGKINLIVGSFNDAHYLESCIITYQYTKTTD